MNPRQDPEHTSIIKHFHHQTCKIHSHIHYIIFPSPRKTGEKWVKENKTHYLQPSDNIKQWHKYWITFNIWNCDCEQKLPPYNTPQLSANIPHKSAYSHKNFQPSQYHYTPTSHFHSHSLPKPTSTFLPYYQVHSCHYHTPMTGVQFLFFSLWINQDSWSWYTGMKISGLSWWGNPDILLRACIFHLGNKIVILCLKDI